MRIKRTFRVGQSGHENKVHFFKFDDLGFSSKQKNASCHNAEIGNKRIPPPTLNLNFLRI